MIKDSMIRFFRDLPEIQTPRLILRRMKKQDYRDMYEYASDPRVTEFLTWDVHPDPSYTMRYLSFISGKYKSGEFYDWAILWREDQKMIGTCGFTSFSHAQNSAEIGYVLNPKFWGREIALEAVRAILDVGFFTLNLHRVEAHYIEGNERSRRVMEKAGMRYEGMYRESMYVRGRYVSVGVCAILASEYILQPGFTRVNSHHD